MAVISPRCMRRPARWPQPSSTARLKARIRGVLVGGSRSVLARRGLRAAPR